MAGVLIGTETLNSSNKNTQVYMATHTMGEGGKRLSLMYRSFISFSYGGKFIEDFGLIATISGDRLQKNIYANFEDDVTTYEVVDGQYYWGTHFTNNSFNFTLSTDGITETQLNEFRHWFKPGIERELVLAENPNRAIMARVAAVPSYSFIPFEEKTTVNIEGTDYKTSTTLYKGDISLLLVADEPFWYGRAALIDYYYTDDENKFGSMTQDITLSNLKETIKDKDFLKAIVEDNIPYVSLLQTDAMLADNTYAILYGEDGLGGSSVIGATEDEDYSFAHIDDSDDPNNIRQGTNIAIEGRIGVVLNSNSTDNQLRGLNITINSDKYLYYSGTAPSKPIIQFTLTPQLNDDGFIKYPLNTYYKENDVGYNTFSIGSQTLKFTLPSRWLGYNQALMIISKIEEGNLSEEVRQDLILGVHEYYSRAWAIHCFDAINGNNTSISSNFYSSFCAEMKKFLTIDGTSNGNLASATFLFDSQKGIAEGSFTVVYENNSSEITEKVGDMLRSNFITIVDRNYPKSNNYITNDECSSISTDYPGGLQNVLITFKNMYY